MIHHALMTLLLVSPGGQEPAPAATGPASAARASDLVPGALPEQTTPAAAARWGLLCTAVSAGPRRERLRAFDLQFDGRAYPSAGSANDFDIKRFLYLDPGWVRMKLKSGRVRLRGPEGDFLLDTKRGTSVRLLGKDFAADIRELEETVRIARSFAALTDPANLRLATLKLGTAPPNLPPQLTERGAGLEWLELASPDFHPTPPPAAPGTAPAREQLFRVRIGCDPVTHLPSLAVIQEATDGQARIETAMLLDLQDFTPIDGYQVPGKVRTHTPDAAVSPWVFAERLSMELWLVKGSLTPDLTEQDFLPPKQ